MSVLVIDVETLPKDQDEKLQHLIEHKLRNLSTLEEKEARRTQLRFLDPVYNKICAIGTLNESDDGRIKEKVFFSRDDEFQMLTDFAKYVENYKGTFVHFNGLGFDVPLIMAKCAEYGVLLPQRFCTLTRYRTNPHYDIMQVYGCWGAFKPSLNELAYTFGLESPKDILGGKSVVEFLQAATDEEIKEYCMGDVRVEHQLFKKIHAIYQ